MIEVRVRRACEADGVVLCRMPLLDVERVIPQLRRYGGLTPYTARALTGQFVMTDTAAYFEVVVGDETTDRSGVPDDPVRW